MTTPRKIYFKTGIGSFTANGVTVDTCGLEVLPQDKSILLRPAIPGNRLGTPFSGHMTVPNDRLTILEIADTLLAEAGLGGLSALCRHVANYNDQPALSDADIANAIRQHGAPKFRIQHTEHGGFYVSLRGQLSGDPFVFNSEGGTELYYEDAVAEINGVVRFFPHYAGKLAPVPMK